MIEQFDIKNKDGIIFQVPCLLLQINAIQICYIIAHDFEAAGGVERIIANTDEWKTHMMGKLRFVGTILKQQLINSMANAGWDFKKHPDPEVLMFTQIKN